MAHYAKIENNIVVEVIVADADIIATREGEWIQTSYNTFGGVHSGGGTPLRKNFAGRGMTYDRTRDAFIPSQPFPSWTLNETTCLWEPPIPAPNTNGDVPYYWDEDTTTWIAAEVDGDQKCNYNW